MTIAATVLKYFICSLFLLSKQLVIAFKITAQKLFSLLKINDLIQKNRLYIKGAKLHILV